MIDDMPPPKRKESDLTLRIDRSLLPPISSPALAAVGVDPNHPESERLIAADLDEDEGPTLVPCPNCEGCGICGGLHAVTPRAAARHRAMIARLESLSEPEDESA